MPERKGQLANQLRISRKISNLRRRTQHLPGLLDAWSCCMNTCPIAIMFLYTMMSAMDIRNWRLALSESTDKGATLQMGCSLAP